jgi:hypothetical protein
MMSDFIIFTEGRRQEAVGTLFVTGIYAPLQKLFALKDEVLDPIFLINLLELKRIKLCPTILISINPTLYLSNPRQIPPTIPNTPTKIGCMSYSIRPITRWKKRMNKPLNNCSTPKTRQLNRSIT